MSMLGISFTIDCVIDTALYMKQNDPAHVFEDYSLGFEVYDHPRQHQQPEP